MWLGGSVHTPPGAGGYSLIHADGQPRLSRYTNTLDYSLDLIKLREVYQKTCRRSNFTFTLEEKEYCKQVINVTFRYAVREFNRVGPGLYVRVGYSAEDIRLTDCACVREGRLIALQTGAPFTQALGPEVLGRGFVVEQGAYQVAAGLPVRKSPAELRQELYHNGFWCDGVHYVRYKRSSGSSRVGRCLFINSALYPRMHKWELCGLPLREGGDIDLAAWESYISLTLSSIVDTIEIRPENILVIDDYSSVFQDRVMITTRGPGGLQTHMGDATVRNSIWDGQSLIDQSLLGKYSRRGFVLLRNRFFKSACFNTNLARWFGWNNIRSVDQLRGYTLAKSVEEIKLITTPSSIKYLKFGSLRQWLKRLEPRFGLVKHEKPTHFFGGRMVQTHYQLLNTLRLSHDETQALLAPSLEYLSAIKTNPAVLRYHIKYHYGHDSPGEQAPVTANDVVYRFLGHNPRFAQTKLYHSFRQDLIRGYLKNLRRGHVLVRGTYATLFGNPMEMLCAAIGTFDGASQLGVGNICSSFFPYGQELLGSRSPHVTIGNVLVARNRRCEDIQRFFNLTPEIVCVNAINENIMARLSGCDFDSDTMLLTDNPLLLNAAKRHYHSFLVPTADIPAAMRKRVFTPAEKADLDIGTSVNKIGEIINLAQELNSLIWDRLNGGAEAGNPEVAALYRDAATLSVLSNLEIDKAKREYAVDSAAELRAIRKRWARRADDGRPVKPLFFQVIVQDKKHCRGKEQHYRAHLTAMDHLHQVVNAYRSPQQKREFIPFSQLLDFPGFNKGLVYYDQGRRVIDAVRRTRRRIRDIWSDADEEADARSRYAAAQEELQRTIRYINSLKINNHTMLWLLRKIQCDQNQDIRQTLLTILLTAKNQDFYRLVERSYEAPLRLVECPTGDISIHGIRFAQIRHD